MTPARQTGPETATIKCEACKGRGWHFTGIVVDGMRETEHCDLCSGTGREPSTVQPKEQKP